MLFVMCFFTGLCVFLSGVSLLLVLRQRSSLNSVRKALEELEEKAYAVPAGGCYAAARVESPRPDRSRLQQRFA
ncbi:MAG: hypothetical protein R6X08_08170, partial [Desulfosalsimonadaceae bacterium]